MARSSSVPLPAAAAFLALWLGLAAIVVVIDQFVKALITGDFRLGEERPVTSFFSVVRWHNTARRSRS